MSTADSTSETSSGCVNGCNAPFGVRCSVCNTDSRAARDVFYVEVRHVIRVEVLAGVYNNPAEANADSDFAEYLTSPMELVDVNGWSVITDQRQIERLESYGPGPWTLTSVHRSRAFHDGATA